MRRLIVNADDFGISEGVNRGIIEAHLRGILTSTTLMVKCRASSTVSKHQEIHQRWVFI